MAVFSDLPSHRRSRRDRLAVAPDRPLDRLAVAVFWLLLMATSLGACLATRSSTATFGILFGSKAISILMCHGVWAMRRGTSRFEAAQVVRSVVMGALLAFCAGLVFEPPSQVLRSAILADLAGSLVVIGAIAWAPEERRVSPLPPSQAIPPSVRSSLQGRRVVICGSDRALVGVLSQILCRARAVVIQVDLEAESGLRETMMRNRPSAVIVADGPAPASLDRSAALLTRRIVRDAMGAEVGILVRIAPRHQGADGEMANRVLEAFSGLTPTILLAVGISEGHHLNDIATSTIDLIARAQDGNLAIMDEPREGQDCERLWQALDLLEGRPRQDQPTRLTVSGPGSEGSESALAQ